MEIGQSVPKKIFEGFLPYGLGGHLGHVTNIILINVHFLHLKAYMYIQNLVINDPVVSEKSKFQVSYLNDLGPRSRNDLDIQYSH